MSLILAMIFGGLGTTFGRLGAQRAGAGGGGGPAGPAPMMRFNDAANSQLLVVLEDF